MAETKKEQATTYPLAAWNFRVTKGGSTMRFAKVSGLLQEFRTLSYRDGLSFGFGERLIRYKLKTWTSLILEQGTIVGKKDIQEWLEGGEVTTLQVSLCDADGNAAVTWNFAKAMPVKLSAGAWDAASNAVAIDTLEVKVTGISIEHHRVAGSNE